MLLSGEAYSKRLEEFSDDTLRLISEVDRISREAVYKCSDITSDSDLTEEQVVEQLEALLKEAQSSK